MKKDSQQEQSEKVKLIENHTRMDRERKNSSKPAERRIYLGGPGSSEGEQDLVSRNIAESVRMKRAEESESVLRFSFMYNAGDISQLTVPYRYCMPGELFML